MERNLSKGGKLFNLRANSLSGCGHNKWCSRCFLLYSLAMCGQTEKQSLTAIGEISSDGRRSSVPQCKGLNPRPGGNGGGMERTAVRRPGSALAVGVKRSWTGMLVFISKCSNV